jgi:uncharacterized protein involved in response to NO
MSAQSPLIPDHWRAEPYRVLFPLGLIGAVIGLGVWIPHFLWPDVFGYPGQSHAVIQIQGFLLCFIFGFLCTMLPKVLGVSPLGTFQFILFPAGIIGIVAASLAGAPLAAQLLHLALLVNFMTFIAMRWRARRGNPPVFFVFIAAAMAADLAGTMFRVLSLTGQGSPQNFRLGALLQYQAFPLLLILGVGSFLLPKLFAGVTIDSARLAASGTPVRSLLAVASLFLLGYGVETWLPVYPLSIQLGSGLRAVVWLWFLFGILRLHRIPAGQPAYLAAARFSLYAIGLGTLLPAFLPAYVLAWEHLVFITGMLWLTITIAARVATAHGGQLDRLETRRKTVLAYGWLLALAALTRASTDIWTGARGMHLALASLFALAALGLWTGLFARLFFRFPGGFPNMGARG